MQKHEKPQNVRVLGFGDNVVDRYEHCKIYYPGGNCLNFAVYAKQLNVEQAAYMGYFGDDEEGSYVKNVLNNLGVDISFAKQIPGENGRARVTIEDGDRKFLGSNNGGVRRTTPYNLGAEELMYMKNFDVVHSGNYSFTEKNLPIMRKAGVKISFDFSDDSKKEYYEKVAPNVNYAFCSMSGTEEEIKTHLKWVKSLGPDLVMASCGADGCIMYDGNTFYRQKAIPIDTVVDTMGAGDSLIASFIVAYLSRIKSSVAKKEAIVESLKDATAFAAKTCGISGSFGYGKKYSE